MKNVSHKIAEHRHGGELSPGAVPRWHYLLLLPFLLLLLVRAYADLLLGA